MVQEPFHRILTRMVEMPLDLLNPPTVPKSFGSLPVPVVYSSSRPVTFKNQQDWNIPPCISNWGNLKGYDIEINKNFAKLSEALYEADQRASEVISMRLEVQKEMEMVKEKKRKEQEFEGCS